MTTRIATRNGKPAHQAFVGRVTQSMIREHGSYRAALAWLAGQGADVCGRGRA